MSNLTVDQAMLILHPDTTLVALSEVEYYAGFNGKEARIKAVEEACIVVCDYIKQLREENKKLAALDKIQQEVIEEYRARLKKSVELPVSIGNTVYVITEYVAGRKEIIKCRVNTMRVKSNGLSVNFSCMGRYGDNNYYNGNFTNKSIGKTVFLTKEEAENKLEDNDNATI